MTKKVPRSSHDHRFPMESFGSLKFQPVCNHSILFHSQMPPLTKTPPPYLNGSANGLTQTQTLEYLIHSYPYLDLEVLSDNLFDGAWNVVSSVFPVWKRDNVKFTQCKDGITNQCKCYGMG